MLKRTPARLDTAIFGDTRMRSSFNEICDRLWRPTVDWTPWKLPKKRLPIDLEVEQLIARSRSPSLRPKQEIEKLYSDARDGCPFEITRRVVRYAVLTATLEQLKLEEIAAPIKGALAKAKDTEKALDETISDFITNLRLAVRIPEAYQFLSEDAPDYNDLSALKDLSDALIAAKIALRPALNLVRDHHSRLSQHHGDVWAITFVTRLGFGWKVLTDCDPSPSSQLFLDFVNGAWRSLEDPAPPDRPWESQVRTACKKQNGKWAEVNLRLEY